MRRASALAAALMLTMLTAQASTIDSVGVGLTSTAPVPESMMRRMQAGIGAAAEQLYLGKDSDQVEQALPAYTKATTAIVDRILYGYAVENLSINPGSHTEVNVHIEPDGPVLREAHVKVHYGNLTPTVRAYIDEDLQGLSTRVEQLLIGLPVDSLDWTLPVMTRTIRDDVETRLPEFTGQVDISDHGEVDIYLIPHGKVLRYATSHIESKTLPSTLFYSTKRYFDQYVTDFEGVPVDFVQRHQQAILADVTKHLAESRAIRQFKVTMTPELRLDDQLDLAILVDSSRYILQGEGYLDFGRSEQSTGFKVFTGIHSGKSDWYLETNFYPDSYKWRFWPSYAYHITPDTMVGYQYEANHQEHRIWMKQDIGNRFHIRAQRNLTDKKNEFGLAYDLHSYVTLEYVVTNGENWLRMIGHI